MCDMDHHEYGAHSLYLTSKLTLKCSSNGVLVQVVLAGSLGRNVVNCGSYTGKRRYSTRCRAVFDAATQWALAGTNPITGDRVYDERIVANCLSLM